MAFYQRQPDIIIRNGTVVDGTGKLPYFADSGFNIEHMTNRSKKDYAITVLDTDMMPTDEVVAKIKAVPGILRVRVIAKQ